MSEVPKEFTGELESFIREIVRDELSKAKTEIHTGTVKVKIDAQEFIDMLTKKLAAVRGGDI